MLAALTVSIEPVVKEVNVNATLVNLTCHSVVLIINHSKTSVYQINTI